MILNRKEIEEILGILDTFPEVKTFELETEGENGIGTYLCMTFDQEINGHCGSFKIEISGVENW